MSQQKPSIGRIVLVPMDPITNNGADVAPAMITRVWSDTMINVRIFPDATGDAPARTSVRLYATQEEAEAAVKNNAANTHMRFAYWPPRV